MSNDFVELILQIDTRERQKSRVNRIKQYFEEYGGCVEIAALPNEKGLDYAVTGFYKNQELNLGIEYKQFWDFVSTNYILETRLKNAMELYDRIALVIEGASKATLSQSGRHAWYINPAANGKTDNLLNAAMFEDRIQIWSESGVLVRNIRTEEEFSQTFHNLLDYCVKPLDWIDGHKITRPGTTYSNQYTNAVLALGIKGLGLKTVQKIIKRFPNFHWLSSYAEEHLQEELGKKTGTNLYNFLHSHELETNEWRNGVYNSKETINNKDLQENSLSKCPLPPKNLNIGAIDRAILIYLKRKDMSIEELMKEFGCTSEKILPVITYLKNQQKLWFNQETKKYSSKLKNNILVNDSLSLEPSDNDQEMPVSASLALQGVLPPVLPVSPNNQDVLESICKEPLTLPVSLVSKNILESIRKEERSLKELEREFGYTSETILSTITYLMSHRKVWFNKETKKYSFGLDKNIIPVTADKETEVL